MILNRFISLKSHCHTSISKFQVKRKKYFTRVQHSEPIADIGMNPFLNKIKGEFNKAKGYYSEGNFSEAFSLFQYCLEFSQFRNLDVDSNLLSKIHFYVALSAHQIQIFDPTEHYEKALEHVVDNDVEVLIRINYASFLSEKDQNSDAIEQSLKALKILEDQNRKFDLNIPAINGNLAGFYLAESQLERANHHSEIAYKLFLKELGKYNDYTRTAFINYCHILQKQDSTDKINEENLIWENYTETQNETCGLTDTDLKKLQLKAILELFSIKGAEPEGAIKGEQLIRYQLSQFFQTWVKNGNSLDDPALLPVFKQEVEHLKITNERYVKQLEELSEKYIPLVKNIKSLVHQELVEVSFVSERLGSIEKAKEKYYTRNAFKGFDLDDLDEIYIEEESKAIQNQYQELEEEEKAKAEQMEHRHDILDDLTTRLNTPPEKKEKSDFTWYSFSS